MGTILSRYSAEQLRQIIARKQPLSDTPAGAGVKGRLSVFVRCTSSTAADVAGVGAQCYPGVIVDPNATLTTQPELAAVWLSLLPNGVPIASRVYECILTGEVAVGSESRPRAFSESAAPCCPDKPNPETVPLQCPSGGSGSGPDIGTICSIGHSEPPACNFLASSVCPLDNPPSYSFTSLASGTTVSTTQMTCIIANSSCSAPSITWKACQITGSGSGPCASVKGAPGYCVKICNGTASYSPVAGVGAQVLTNLDSSGYSISYATTDNKFAISGTLVWCCKNGVTGLYFRGKISSQVPNPENPTGFPCGCLIDIKDGCSADNVESITAGPLYTAGTFTNETLHIKTDCGEFDIVISPAPCSPPPPPASNCPSPPAWTATISGFTGCLAGLNGSWTFAFWFTSGGIPNYLALGTTGGFPFYWQVFTNLVGGVPFIELIAVEYSGTISNQVNVLAVYTLSGMANCCSATALALSGVLHCPNGGPAGTGPAFTGSFPATITVTPSGAGCI